jgi:hypothetical protein
MFRLAFARAWLAAWVLVATSILQCTSDNERAGLTEACDRFASEVCSYGTRCDPVWLRAEYGDEGTCRDRTVRGCMQNGGLRGTSWTPDAVLQCAQAYAASCYGGAGPTDCALTSGNLSDGEVCAYDIQCGGGRCQRDVVADDAGFVLASCGTCSYAPCNRRDTYCSAPTICWGGSCVIVEPEGADCGGQHVCRTGLRCFGTICVRPAGAGAACADSEDCDAAQGLRCVQQTCQAPAVAAVGESCESAAASCAAGARCMYQPTGEYRCTAAPTDGSPCDAANGPPCLYPAECRDGICKMPSVDDCR